MAAVRLVDGGSWESGWQFLISQSNRIEARTNEKVLFNFNGVGFLVVTQVSL